MTTQVYFNAVSCAYLSIENANFIIFDECHHATGNHPMAQVCLVATYTLKLEHVYSTCLLYFHLGHETRPRLRRSEETQSFRAFGDIIEREREERKTRRPS